MALGASFILETGKNLAGLDKAIEQELIDLATQYSIQLTHIQDLLLIESVIQNDADRQRIHSIISFRLKVIADVIELSIKRANIEIADSHSQIISGIATKLRDDLRELKELLKNN